MQTTKSEIKKLYAKSGIPNFHQNCKFSTHYKTARSDSWKKVADKIRSDAFKSDLRFKIVYGEHNVGKTVLLSCATAEACNNGKNVLYVKEDDLINHETEIWTAQGIHKKAMPLPLDCRNIRNDKTEEWHSTKVEAMLMFDELGCQSYVGDINYKYKNLHNKMNNYIDRILDQNVYVLFATNYKLEKIKERVGQKFWARIEKGGYKYYEI